MIRSVLVIAAVVGDALLMPAALLGVFLGFSGLSISMLYPKFSGLSLLINLCNLLLGLGGVLGFSAFLAAELAPRHVQRVGRQARMAVLFGLAWGSVTALVVGILVTLSDSSGLRSQHCLRPLAHSSLRLPLSASLAGGAPNVAPNLSIERTSLRWLRQPKAAAHVER